MINKKYEFPTKKLKDKLIKELKDELSKIVDKVDEEGNKIQVLGIHGLVDLNKLILVPAEINNKGEVVTSAIKSKGWCVDVKWVNQEKEGWSDYAVEPKNPKHVM